MNTLNQMHTFCLTKIRALCRKFLTPLSGSQKQKTYFTGLVASICVGECISVTTTRAISTVAREEASKCSVLSAAVSPDGQVLLLLDEGVGQVIRLELESGNCRSFAKDLSCKTTPQPIKILINL